MQKIALNERSLGLIKNYTAGGAALGGSAALLTSLVNYLKMLKSDADEPTDTSNDDDTLYLNMPATTPTPPQSFGGRRKMAGADDLLSGGLAMTGGTLATIGSYALIKKVYQNIKRKELQAQLDSAQQSFVGAADQEATQGKMAAIAPAAGAPMGLGQIMYSAPVAFTLLSAIASGALSNVALNKTFPAVKPTQNIAPKKIVIRRKKPADVNQNSIPDEEETKTAASHSEDDGLELVTHLVLNSKSASASEVSDIVHAVASGRHNEFVNTLLTYGMDTAMSTIKGASMDTLDKTSRVLAVGQCIKSAALRPIFSMLVAAEYNDMAPHFFKIASLQTPEDTEVLVKIASILGAIYRHEHLGSVELPVELTQEDNTKAANNLTIADILEMINSQRYRQQHKMHDGVDDSIRIGNSGNDPMTEGNDDMHTEDSITSSEEQMMSDEHPTNNQASPGIANELDDEDDFIDNAMSGTITPAKAVAAQND